MKKVILIALLLSLVYPAFYLVFQLLTPKGFVFSGMIGGDDGTNLAVMASVNHNLENLWALEEPKNIFLNPNLGPAYLYVPLGYLAKLLGNRFLFVFHLARFLGVFAFLLSAYVFLKEFFGQERAFRILLLFCLSFGLGGFSFLLQREIVPRPPFTGMWQPATYEMFEGAGLTPLTIFGRSYYTLPLACGLLSLVFLKKRKMFWGGMLLGLTFLIYPTLGVAFCGISGLYLLTAFGGSLPWSEASVYYLISIIGVVPWIGSYLADPTMFDHYLDLKIAASPFALFVSILPHLLFVFYLLFAEIKGKKTVLALAVLLLVFALVPKFPARGLLRYSSFLAIFALVVWELRKKKELLFFTLWLLGALFLSILPPHRNPFFSVRFLLVVWLPLVVLSYLGMEYMVRLFRSKISAGLLVALVIVFTFPSAVFFSTHLLRKAIEPQNWPLLPDYLFENELAAHQFLKHQPEGTVLSSEEIGSNLPFLTGKKSVMGRRPVIRDYRDKTKDYYWFFFDGASASNRLEIIEKYGIDYVYFGEYERVVSEFKVNLEKEKFLEVIFEEPGVQIFKVL